eukprot:1385511-Rhodomonas_salina.2
MQSAADTVQVVPGMSLISQRISRLFVLISAFVCVFAEERERERESERERARERERMREREFSVLLCFIQPKSTTRRLHSGTNCTKLVVEMH